MVILIFCLSLAPYSVSSFQNVVSIALRILRFNTKCEILMSSRFLEGKSTACSSAALISLMYKRSSLPCTPLGPSLVKSCVGRHTHRGADATCPCAEALPCCQILSGSTHTFSTSSYPSYCQFIPLTRA